jgi:hypothetical protein
MAKPEFVPDAEASIRRDGSLHPPRRNVRDRHVEPFSGLYRRRLAAREESHASAKLQTPDELKDLLSTDGSVFGALHCKRWAGTPA